MTVAILELLLCDFIKYLVIFLNFLNIYKLIKIFCSSKKMYIYIYFFSIKLKVVAPLKIRTFFEKNIAFIFFRFVSLSLIFLKHVRCTSMLDNPTNSKSITGDIDWPRRTSC